MAEQATAPTPAAPVAATPEAPKPAEQPVAAGPSREELAHAAKVLAAERKRLADERASFADKEKRYSEWEAVQKDKLRNPGKYLATDYGENWYDTLTNFKLRGVPPVDLAVSEAEQRMSKQLEPLQKKLETLEQEKARQQEEAYFSDVATKVKAAGEKYRLLNGTGRHSDLEAVIREHWNATAKRGEDGNVQGELLTAEQAADKIESNLREIKKLLNSIPDEAPAAKETPPEPAQRRLSTDPNEGFVPPAVADDNERRKRAIAAWDKAQAARPRTPQA